MPQGLQVIGDHGVLQIDELYRNMAKRASGTWGTPSLANAVSAIIANRTLNTAGVHIGGLNISGSTWEWKARTSPISTSYWIFDVPVSTGNIGLQVFDATGALVFDSINDYLKVVGVYELNYPSTPFAGYTQPGGKTHAWIQMDGGFWEKDNISGLTDQGGYAVYMNGSGQLVTVHTLALGTRSGAAVNGSIINIRKPRVVVVDVTGM